MIYNCNVYYDGYNYIANIPDYHSRNCGGKRHIDKRFEKFKELYCEAKQHKLTNNGVVEYIQDKFIESFDDIMDGLLTDEEAEDYLDRHLSNINKRLKRLKRKAALGEWNYFVTLT